MEVVLMPGKKLEHLGIKIELVGTIGALVFAWYLGGGGFRAVLGNGKW